MKKVRLFYVLEKYKKEFPIEGFIYKRHMAVERAIDRATWHVAVRIYNNKETALKVTAKIRNTFTERTDEDRGVKEIIEYALREETVDEYGEILRSRLIE